MIYKKALICKTKNLFSTSTEVGTLSGWSNTTPRQFEEGKWYIGITANNYYSPNEIVEYEFTENYAYVKTKGGGYGIGRAFKCEPNQTYTVSCKWIKNTNNINIATGFFDENGNYLSFIGADDLVERHTFTTPANCKWFTVCFPGTVGSSYIYNIQLEKGSTPTDFVTNGYLQSYKKAIKVSDIFVNSYKSTVICKTKNLFDISKVTNWSSIVQADDKDIICFIYGAPIGILKDLCPSLKVGDTVTLSLIVKSTTSIPSNFVQIQGQILNFEVGNGSVTFTVTEEGLNSNFYLYNTTYENREVPTTTVFTDIMIELGDTATSYVPYGHL